MRSEDSCLIRSKKNTEMKEILIKFQFDDEGGYKGHGEDVSKIIHEILKREIEITLEDDGVIKKGWKLEVHEV